MAAILKTNQGPEVETSDPLLAAAPRKVQASGRDEPEEVEQLKETSEPRDTKRVPLERAEAGRMDVVRFSGPPEGETEDELGLPNKPPSNKMILGSHNKKNLLIVLKLIPVDD